MKIQNANLTPVLLLVLALCSVTYPAAHAADSRASAASELDETARRRFDSAFVALSEQAKGTILVEGTPLHGELTDEQLSELDQKLPPNASASAAISAVAAAFDYDVETVDAHTILLRKRYSNPIDLPCVTYEEIVHSVREVLKTTYLLYPHNANDTPYANLLRLGLSLTSDQLKTAGRGVRVDDLAPEQRPLAINAALETMLRQDALEEILRRLLLLQDPHTVFVWSRHNRDNVANAPLIDVLGYRGAFGTRGYPVDMPLTNGFKARTYSSDFDAANSKSGIVLSNPTEEDRRLVAIEGVRQSAFAYTLREAALLGSPSSATNETFRVTVQDGIADKPVCVYGDRFSSHEHTIRSLAKLYGLQLLVPRSGIFAITMPSANHIDGLHDLSAEVDRVTPLPIKRALAGQAARTAPNLPIRSIRSLVLPQTGSLNAFYLSPTTREEQMHLARHTAIDAWYYPAVRRLLVKAQTLVPTPQSPSIPIKAAGTEVVRLIALTMLTGSPLEELDNLADWKVPSYFDQPEAMAMQIGFHPGHDVAIGVGTIDPATGNVGCNIFRSYGIHMPQ